MKKLLFLLLCVPALAEFSGGGGGAVNWRASVANQGALPTSGNVAGDCRSTTGTGLTYCWNGSAWVSTAGVGATPGGSHYSVQVNDGAGGFTGDTGFSYDATNVNIAGTGVNTSALVFSHNATAGNRPWIGYAANDYWLRFEAPHANGAMEFHVGGNNIFELKTDQVVSSYPHIFAAGDATAPSLFFSNSFPARGFYYDGTGPAITVSGKVGSWDSTGYLTDHVISMTSNNKILFGSASDADRPYISQNSVNTRLKIAAPNASGLVQIYAASDSIVFNIDNPFTFTGADVTVNDHDIRTVNSGTGNLGSASKRWGNLYTASFVDSTQISTPSSPASGGDRLYFKSDDKLYRKTSGGTETLIGPTSGGTGNMVGPGSSLAGQLTYFTNTDGVTTSASTVVASGDDLTSAAGGKYYVGGNTNSYVSNISDSTIINVHGSGSARITAGAAQYVNLTGTELQLSSVGIMFDNGNGTQHLGARNSGSIESALDGYSYGWFALQGSTAGNGFSFHNDSNISGNYSTYRMFMPTTSSIAIAANNITAFLSDNAGLVTLGAGTTNVNRINGALVDPGASTATLLTSPVAGEPAKWFKVNLNGTAYVIPAWTAP